MSRILTIVLMLLVLGFGVFLGSRLNGRGDVQGEQQKKMLEAYSLMKTMYVDDVAGDSLAGAGIQGMAEYLDPHTVYLEPEKVSYSQAEFDGNFDGIGIEFDISSDTLLVVTPLSGGPSAAVGILPGDRILAIDSLSALGITEQQVLRKLRGRQGTQVKLRVFRPLSGKIVDFTVTRSRISTSSIDAAFMLDSRVGYIRLSRFIATTADEFRTVLVRLKKQGMKRLVIDLRGNPGGFLEQAVAVADEFLPKGALIVYTKSRNGGVENERFIARSGDSYETGEVIVLVDKGSASASEILAGALQDNRRAVVVGEQTFGKGLVQRQLQFADGSAIRLTVSRYYTPSGRQIQRVYHKGGTGRESYFQDALTTIRPEKLFTNPDSLLYLKNSEVSVYRTSSLYGLLSSLNGKVPDEKSQLLALKNAGGIIPDFWVTGKSYSDFYQELFRSGSFDDIALKIIDDPRSLVQQHRGSLESFLANYSEERVFEALVIKTCKLKKIRFDRAVFLRDRLKLVQAVKSRIAHQLFGAVGQITFVVQSADPVVRIAASVPMRQP
ncbi:S41 family peptidase [Chlorobium ferrooxidans]|uniref:Carboxyl-terminal protease n=1 Tax=Chlorobium ferrooxidans DSM 13031 TaxID=377431 RepID=Q0YT09_9CHLB|nr:S41 family peptidase [Chlorobium ferrooxidans]EAT59455.1 carboxyl-terminal protease [Chlorobium ferrooxidans DSM 13031]